MASGVAEAAVRTRGALKQATRAAGVLTAGWRQGPDFLVIGTKRGGTTSFYLDLVEHPSVLRLFPPPVPGVKGVATKGVHYFDTHYARGARWYRSYMPTRLSRTVRSRLHGAPALVGEASPYYLFHPDAARRAAESVPDVRLVALLRDPVARTYSHWKERRRNGAEPLDFVAALEAEPARLAGERTRLLTDPTYTSYAWEQQSYATQSRYADSLRPWVEKFGADRLHLVASEDYYADPVRVLGDVDEFLGLPRRSTATGVLHNAAPGAPLPSGLAHRLRTEFAEANDELFDLAGRRFPWV